MPHIQNAEGFVIAIRWSQWITTMKPFTHDHCETLPTHVGQLFFYGEAVRPSFWSPLWPALRC